MAKKGMSIRFIGAEKFIKDVNNKSQETQQAIGKIVQETASNIERKAKQKAPVSKSITNKSGKVTHVGGFMRSKIYSEKIDDLTAEAGSKADYSVYVDKGTRYQKAQPFFTPAVESERAQFKKKIKKVVE